MSVNDAVIDCEGHIGHWTNEDCILALDLLHNDTLLQLADPQDRCLSLMKDDGRCEKRTRDAINSPGGGVSKHDFA